MSFFFPSTFEGSPKVIVEAAACGVPVICRSCYQPETVVHGLTGYQASSDDELYSFLQRLLDNSELRLKMGRAGRQHNQQYDWDVITRQWAGTFCEIVESRTLRYAS